ncbi:MAG: DNA polymerase III subunit gamma/tau [Candidatus Chloroheliales bacterium]|nr:MAG: DNA polymerase III subunit gamma/tau [Chloroflexota bacterium]
MDLFNPNPGEETSRRQSLYRKWRSQTFGELVGQEHIIRTLQNALSSGRIVHAYLFTGPRGTGKTSTARLLAKAVNCLRYSPAAVAAGEPVPCGECENCRAITEGRAIDLVEIDAASNTGVDDVRVLRDGVNFSPTSFRYRVYIIDEVHMLSTAAFNALLKTLEEPPPHAIFILATTEVHKIPATVISRVQRYDFRRIPLAAMVSRLAYICEQEGIAYEPAALELIARSATGSLRDAQSLIDQLIAYSGQSITLAAAQDMLGATGSEQVAAFVDDMIARELGSGLERINSLLANGVDMRQFNRQLVDHLRKLMLLKAGGPDLPALDVTTETMQRLKQQAANTPLPALVAWVKTFSAADDVLRTTPYGQLPLEVAFVEATLTDGTAEPRPAAAERLAARPYQQPAAQLPAPAPRSTATAPASSASNGHPPTAADELATNTVGAQFIAPNAAPAHPSASEAQAEGTQAISFEQLQAKWDEVLDRIGARSKPIRGLLFDCTLEGYENNVVTLRPKYKFHRERVERAENRNVIEELFTKLFGKGQRVRIRCLPSVEEEREAARGSGGEEPMTAARRDPRVRAANNIFDGTIRDVREVR